MKYLAIAAFLLVIVVPTFAASYIDDFEGATPGTLPAGWTLFTPWGDWAPGPVYAEVATAPTGGQALKFVQGTDWANYGASSGEIDYTFDMTGIDPNNALMHYEFDMWKENWLTWQMAGDQSYFPPGGIHMNDNPSLPGNMFVGQDSSPNLNDVPERAWIHVVMDYNSATKVWTTTVSYPGGSGGGTFTGTSTNPVAGQFWFGGWAFKSTMDAGGGVYDNAVYLDNIVFSVQNIPEPGSMLALASGLLGLGGFIIRRRKS